MQVFRRFSTMLLAIIQMRVVSFIVLYYFVIIISNISFTCTVLGYGILLTSPRLFCLPLSLLRFIISIVIPHSKICGCNLSKSSHVTFTKTH